MKNLAVIPADSVITNLSKCVGLLRKCISAEEAKKFRDLGTAATV